MIDKALAQMMRRELVSSGEVTDVLLDVRTLLTLPAPAEALIVGYAEIRSANALLQAFAQQLGLRHRGGVDVDAHVEAVVVAQQREVERHAGQRADRVVLEDLAPRRCTAAPAHRARSRWRSRPSGPAGGPAG